MALLLGTVLLAAAAAVPPAGPAPRELARSVLETHGQELRLLRLLGVARTVGKGGSRAWGAAGSGTPIPCGSPRSFSAGRASIGGLTSASTSRPGSRPAPSPPRIPAAAGAARAGCSAAPPRCPCSPSCPTCRCRWWSAAGSRSPGTAPSPAPLAPTPVIHPPHPPHHHHPRDPPRGLGPLPARPCRDNPAAPCPQRSCNKEISDSDMCVCGAGALGEPGAPSALAKSDGATLGLCNLTRERVTSRDPEGFRCHVPCPGTQRDPPAPRVPTKPRLCGSGLGVCQGWSPGASPQAPVGDKRSPRVALATAMASSWMLLLALLGVACALPAPEPLAYTQALARAVESYNQRPEVQNAFRLLSAEPEPEPGVELSSLQAFNLSMMETECAASARRDPEDCDFKENGVIIECLAKPKMQQVSPEIDLSCSDASSNPVLVERGRFGRFVRKIRRFRPSIRFDARLKGTIRIG